MALGGMFNKSDKEKAEDEVQEIVRDIKDIAGIEDRNGMQTALRNCIKDLSKAPAPKQIGVGALVGWTTGYVTMKVGKMAATAVGGSLLLLQIAHHKGYITVDWNKMTSDSATLADQVKDKFKIKTKTGMEKFTEFASKNVYLAGGFTGGFFLGIASS